MRERTYSSESGRSIRKGQKYRRDDPIVKSNPEFFRTIGRKLGG